MTLKKDDIVELIEKDKDGNGWWLVKKGNAEGWAPNNYLELVPPKPKAAAAPPPPPPPPPPGAGAAAKRASVVPPSATPAAKIVPKSLAADSSAKPVSVFPGMGPSNGSAAPWKKTASTATNGSSNDTTPTSSRPGSSLAGKPPPPPVANKPKPPAPPIGNKPGAPKAPGKPPVPTASRPPAAPPAPKPGGVAKPAAPGGQLDLAAAVRCGHHYMFSVMAHPRSSWLNARRGSRRMSRTLVPRSYMENQGRVV